MKKFLYLILCLFPMTTFAEVPFPRAETGLEAGVARISDGKNALIGPSWAYHFQYEIDPNISFFGQAGSSEAKDNKHEFKQKTFAGGLHLNLIEVVGLRVGFASTAIEIDQERSSELGPLAAITVSVPIGVFRLGTSATVIRTSSMHSMALRMSLLIVF